jgi:tyrosine-protein phosphatase SIW14
MSLRKFRVVPLFLLSLSAFAGSSVHGIRNFHEVDEHVFRGAQPTEEGLRELAQNGVKVIVDLRESGHRSAAEERAVKAAGMRYVNVPMTGLTPPTQEEINTVLQLLDDQSNGPVFVHCMRGADRTGAVIAAYRIEHDHWDNARALREAMADGMSFFQYPRQSYIRNFRPPIMDAKTETEPIGAGGDRAGIASAQGAAH